MKRLISVLAFCVLSILSGSASDIWKAGWASVDITPKDHVWMAGYAFRDKPSRGVRENLYAKALAIEDEDGHRAVIVTADILSIPRDLSKDIRDRVCEKYGIDQSSIIINASHTHSGPVLSHALNCIYPMKEQDWEAVSEYTGQFRASILKVIDKAMAGKHRCRISYGCSQAHFAINRRNNVAAKLTTVSELKGPGDCAVPVIKVENLRGGIEVILFGYACHGTTLNDYLMSGDYPGYARKFVEKMYPGAQAMFFQGCGADQNPNPRYRLPYAIKYGRELCAAVEQALSDDMKTLDSRLDTRYREVLLAMEEPMGKEQLLELSAKGGYIARWAKEMLDGMARNEVFPRGYPYPVTYWNIGGNHLFALGGETTVSYAINLKAAYGPDTIVMGYSNDVMSYIPSALVQEEGGYEADDAHKVYNLPAGWTHDVENRILNAINELVPPRSE